MKKPYAIIVSLKRAEHISYGGGVCWEPWGPFSHSITQHLQYLCREPPAEGGGVTGAK